MTQPRVVRVTEQFFGRLDQLLPAERSADGTPSAADFLLLEMPLIIEKLATDYERSTVASPRVPTRTLVTTSLLVSAVAVHVELIADGTVEVFWLDLDLGRGAGV